MKQTILALALLSIFGAAQATDGVKQTAAPSIDNELTIAYLSKFQDYTVKNKSLFGSRDALGSFAGMTAIQEAKVTIDLDRIAKRSAESDRYVFWLMTNNNFKSVVAAFRDLNAISPYSLGGNDRSSDYSVNDIEEEYRKTVVDKCGIAADAKRAKDNRDGYTYLPSPGWPCDKFEARSTYRKQSLYPVGDAFVTAIMFSSRGTTNYNGYYHHFENFNTNLSLAYMAMFNAAQIASTGHPNKYVTEYVNQKLKVFVLPMVDGAVLKGERAAESESTDRGWLSKGVRKYGEFLSTDDDDDYNSPKPMTIESASAYIQATEGMGLMQWVDSVKALNKNSGMTPKENIEACSGANQLKNRNFCTHIAPDGSVIGF